MAGIISAHTLPQLGNVTLESMSYIPGVHFMLSSANKLSRKVLYTLNGDYDRAENPLSS